MPEIPVTEDQREYLDALRETIAAEHVGDYGHVRFADAIQYLIDHHGPADELVSDGSSADGEAEDGADAGLDDGANDAAGDAGDRLDAMMALLDTHEDKWRETEADGGRYEVDLPEGESTVVRTKDDVRAELFKHYG